MTDINNVKLFRHKDEDTDTHAEVAIYIDDDFCGDFVVAKAKLESFRKYMIRGFGSKLIYKP